MTLLCARLIASCRATTSRGRSRSDEPCSPSRRRSLTWTSGRGAAMPNRPREGASAAKVTPHVRGTVNELGYDRVICAECEVDWPCTDAVMEVCERLDLAQGLPCSCGWHDGTDVFLARDLEQEK